MRHYWAGTEKDAGGHRARVWRGTPGRGAQIVWHSPALIKDRAWARRLADRVAKLLTTRSRRIS
jgi:hypothetical protein